MNQQTPHRDWTKTNDSRFIPIWAALRQKASQVVTREPGRRFLSNPRPASEEAEKDRPFAWLSQQAYGRSVGAKRKFVFFRLLESLARKIKSARKINLDGENILRADGWTLCDDFADLATLRKMKASHLRVEVWTKKDPPSIVVAFGGTVATSGRDWKSNLRWFLPHHQDEYTEIVNDFGPAFVQKFLSRASEREWAYLKHATIYATGHSLGGGLTQQFAYSLKREDSGPRVKHVYAFDPSPVTGYFTVPRNIRDRNKEGLLIDRIYERGEVLAIARSFTSIFNRPSAADPTIRAVRYSLFYPALPISGHSILEFASELERMRPASAS